jgi:hypothetical protein
MALARRWFVDRRWKKGRVGRVGPKAGGPGEVGPTTCEKKEKKQRTGQERILGRNENLMKWAVENCFEFLFKILCLKTKGLDFFKSNFKLVSK